MLVTSIKIMKPLIGIGRGYLFSCLFPENDILTKEIESWNGFADSLHTEEDRNLFKKMLNDCLKYDIII